ncbi:hypothetical protein [Paenibacillus rhizophilus]|nr:hypothetical protein [Paenibacillus rhizophilus]
MQLAVPPEQAAAVPVGRRPISPAGEKTAVDWHPGLGKSGLTLCLVFRS